MCIFFQCRDGEPVLASRDFICYVASGAGSAHQVYFMVQNISKKLTSLQFKITFLFKNINLFLFGQHEFPALLQSSVSHDPSEII